VPFNIKKVAKKITDKELTKLYYTRVRDNKAAKTRRRKSLEQIPKRMDALLTEFFEVDSTALRRIEESRAVIAWPSYVGESAALVSKAQRVRNNTLIVGVTDPLWMQQLSLLKQVLLKRYRKDFPRLGIQDIYFTRAVW